VARLAPPAGVRDVHLTCVVRRMDRIELRESIEVEDRYDMWAHAISESTNLVFYFSDLKLFQGSI
jgi:hypothetical protein